MITKALLDCILNQYALPAYGTHGLSHWARVLTYGRKLAETVPGSLAVVELFAVLHDSKRVNEGTDHQHGQRGAEFAATLRGRYIELDDHQFDLLYTACAYHTDGLIHADPVIQICWDSDRLDLNRVGIKPNILRLCTATAKQDKMIAQANSLSQNRVFPKEILVEWEL